MNNVVIGILAHVDAGKTTLIERMLVRSKSIARAGNVDDRDTVLDFDGQERKRGITIYAKEVDFAYKGTHVFVIDTPGHVDFSSEMERSLQVIDIAIMVVNAREGLESHTETIWKCLEHYQVPTIVFVNKMDLQKSIHVPEEETREKIMEELHGRFSPNCVDYCAEDWLDQLATTSEEMLETFVENMALPDNMVTEALYARKFFPVVFGTALHDEEYSAPGEATRVDMLLDLVDGFSGFKEYGDEFGAKVYKITYDYQRTRLTHVKVTGGTLQAKQRIGEDEQVDQIRMYFGNRYRDAKVVEAGMVCAIKGLVKYEAGQGIGSEPDSAKPILSAYLDYELILPDGANVLNMARICREIADEDPTLEINLDEKARQIHVRIMGDMQRDVLAQKIYERSDVHVGFGKERIIYCETIAQSVEGYGHFEPLRHYAEVHVRLDPLPRGKGIVVDSECPSDMLPMHWQKSILSNLTHKRHKGVLAGADLTDVKIVLTAGRGHLKHTEGGDFRQAALRAVRQGLMKANSQLLEPFVSYVLSIPTQCLGKALADLETRKCSMQTEEAGDRMIVKGRGSLRHLMYYANDVRVYAKGKGSFGWIPDGYDVCEDMEKIVSDAAYDPEADLRNPTGSVFCAHGAGYYVPWDEVEEHLHIDIAKDSSSSSYFRPTYKVTENDLMAILQAAGGKNKNEKKKPKPRREEEDKKKQKPAQASHLAPCLIIDGYNMMYAWDEYKELAREDISYARDKLSDLIFNYQGFTGDLTILVFDGYRVKDNIGSVFTRGNLMIVYTRHDQTADAYIEKLTFDLKGKYQMTVATSDALVQNAAFAHGALRMSARELETRIQLAMGKLEFSI